MPAKRKPLGRPLPPVKGDIPAPTVEEVDRISAAWDAAVSPQWRGLLDAKPLGWEGKPKPRFYYDEVKRVTIRASNGKVVTAAEKRAAYLEFMQAMK